MHRWMFGPELGFVGLGFVVAVALMVSACGNTGGTSTAGQAAEPSSPPAAPAGPPGAAGTVAAVDSTSLQVQNPRTGQVTVTFTPSTSFTRTVAATVADLVVGDCAFTVGTPQPAGDPASPITATSVQIGPAAADGCTAGGFGGPGRGTRAGNSGNRPDGGAPPSRNPNQSPGTGRGRGGTAAGKISSISGSDFAMQMDASTTRTIATTATTTFTKTVTTDHSALAVGECVTAVGPPDDTGAVAASSISIRQPGPTGCQGGFGGPGRGRGAGRAEPGAATSSDDGMNGA